MATRGRYQLLLRLVDTREVGDRFPDLLEAARPRADRLVELGLATPGPQELAELRGLRDALCFAVLDSAPAVSARVGALNSLLRDYRLVPQLAEAADDLSYVATREGRVATLAEQVLPQAVDLLRSGDFSRVQLCSAGDCAAPFVASAAPRARSYCSARCSTRVRVRRFRAAAHPGTAR